ncbi:MAG: DMT family transporter [bacterium]|nr:DMT family transporter [bacterium]
MNTNKGIYLAFLTSIISGFAIFLNKFAVSIWSNSSIFTTAKNLVVAVFLVSLIFLLKKLPELKKLSKKQWLLLLAIGLIGGSVPFLLFFKGLSLASAPSVAFIHKTLFVWVALLAVPFLKEKLSGLQFLSFGIILTGLYLLKPLGSFSFGYAEILIFGATLLWAVENVIAKIALRGISPLVVGSGRMFFGSLFLLAYLIYTGEIGGLFILSGTKIWWLIASGAILFGYVVSWYSALKMAPAVTVSAILVVAGPITIVLDSIFVSHRFSVLLVIPIVMITVGALFFTNFLAKFKILLRKIPFSSWRTVS